VRVTFSKGGAHAVTLTEGGQTARTVTVLNRPPVAAFTAWPAQPAPGQAVTFDGSSSSDPDGTVTAWDWDWTGNGNFADHGKVVSHAFERGSHTVTLRVTDDQRATATKQMTILVASPPTAAFTVDTPGPVAGQAVSFTSQASSPGGSIVSRAWDLDGSGKFAGGSGSTATATYSPGTYTVSQRVVDDLGQTAISFQSVTVGPAPAAPAAGGPPSQGVLGARARGGLSVFSPAPFIRIRGHTTGRGALIDLFTVRAPSGATVVVRCKGRTCPFKVRRSKVGGRGVGIIRVRAVEKHLRAGIVLEVRVTKAGFLGKFTRLRIDRLKAPLRWDGCLVPGDKGPTQCQGGA
jgi:hypothetical protein